MHYSIDLYIKGTPIWFKDSFLPGIVPDHVIDLLTCQSAEFLGLCKLCELDCKCHVIGDDGTKYCIVLFHDAFRPKWKIKDVS